VAVELSGRVEVEDLHKSLAGQPVLRGLDLRVEAGEAVAILGPSGCGKTVFLRHVVGLLTPDRGEVRLDGEAVHRLPPHRLREVRAQVGVVFQGAALFDSLTVGENVAFPLRRHRRLPESRIKEIVVEKLNLVGMGGTEGKMPAELSGGMRKRVGIARALALDPKIVLYDEPTAGLDPVTARAVDRLMTTLRTQTRTTTVLVTHDLLTAFAVADRIAVMDAGQFVVTGPKETVRASPHPLVQAFLHSSGLGGLPPEAGR
jgi:phospholipid/cholesterol/gamma-HCH transport system ATP-binding protein